MMDLRELYQETILDHNRNPRNHREILNPTCQARGFNPLCGDKLTVYVNIDNKTIKDLSFLGCGCAISQASSSLMTETLIGKTVTEAHEIFERFHHMLTQDDSSKGKMCHFSMAHSGSRFEKRGNNGNNGVIRHVWF